MSFSYITDKNGEVIQHTEYMAFGEVLVDEHSTTNKMPYLFNGKELDYETGLYYYGARYYDPKTSLWLNTDPLMEKYPEVSPYTYSLNNPIMLIDPDGREPIGPPKTIFINGYLMLGSLEGGKKYWNNSFIQGALNFSAKTPKDFLSIQPIFVHYDPTPLSSAKDRTEEGYRYAQTNYSYLTKGMNIKEDYFNIVDHSMGVAFGEGVSKYLQERGWEINKVIHINGFQASDIEVNKSSKPFVISLDKPQIIDYQNTDDPVINNPIRSSPGDIKNSSYKIRENSGKKRDYIHASPISRGKEFWRSLSETLNKGNYEK